MFKRFKDFLKRFRWWLLLFVTICLILFYLILPEPLFNDPLSTLVTSENGEMLAAKIASDGQWRFPSKGKVPYKFEKSILQFEDQYFFRHPGINPVSLYKALARNISNKRVVNGGSTITMQVIRLARKGKSRTYKEKLIEITLALRLECSFSKDEILSLYAANAPFGGNVVGLEAAARRYFGRAPDQLSWAEASTLAVLPNAPSLIYPGKNSQALLKKRNRLLKSLYEEGLIAVEDYHLSLKEPLPGKPVNLPLQNTHLMQELCSDHGQGQYFVTSIIPELQNQVVEAAARYLENWQANGVYNAGLMITEVETGKVIAYMGNVGNNYQEHARSNNMILTPRSSGSILKPLLYGGMMQQGQFFPMSLQADVPTDLGGYSPKNYNLNYSGAVPARNAISRSLNVPAVRMLSRFGVANFHSLLKKLGMSTLSNKPSHYGLSLILGGAETTLWDLSEIYAGLAVKLNHANRPDSNAFVWNHLKLLPSSSQVKVTNRETVFDAAVIYEMFEAMSDVNRPDAQAGWKDFLSQQKVAWKTGTSFGHRDAWAVGVTPSHVVSVWVGNASGEGKPLLTGVGAAGPLLFDVLALLPSAGWFQQPIEQMAQIDICAQSGDRAGLWCENKALKYVPKSCLNASLCRFHKIVHVDKASGERSNLSCSNQDDLITMPFFILPPLIEYYYKQEHPEYVDLPPWKSGCSELSSESPMQFVYPPSGAKLIIPKSYDGNANNIIAQIAHRNADSRVFWFLNGKQMQVTRTFHQQAIQSVPGDYELLAVDEEGNRITRKFRIVTK